MPKSENFEQEYREHARDEAFESFLDAAYFLHAIDFMDPNRKNLEYEQYLKNL